MLARENRLVRADDYRNTVRRGRRLATKITVVYVIHRADGADTRFGFIVSKAVGNAVSRNLIRRRLKSVARALVTEAAPNIDVVVRALPAAVEATWSELRTELAAALEKDAASLVSGKRGRV